MTLKAYCNGFAAMVLLAGALTIGIALAMGCPLRLDEGTMLATLGFTLFAVPLVGRKPRGLCSLPSTLA